MITVLGIILLVWLAAAAILIGLGLLFRRALAGGEPPGGDTILEAFWVGYCLTLLYLQAWHFALPISQLTVVPLAPAAMAGWWLARRASPKEMPKRGWLVGGLALGIFAWIALLSTAPAILNDTGLYHRPLVNWYRAFPIVPGLANLNLRFGYNSPHLLYGAVLDSFFPGRAEHLVGGPLVIALMAQIAHAGWRLLQHPTRGRLYAFDLVLLGPILFVLLGRDLASFSTDLALTALLFAVTPLAYRYLAVPPASHALRRHRLAALVLMLGTTGALKLTAAPFAGAAVLVLLGTAVADASGAGRVRRVLLLPTTICLAVAGLWAARSVILSGYPVYPSVVGGAEVDWRVHETQVRRHNLVAGATTRFFFAEGRTLLNEGSEDLRWDRWIRRWLGHVASFRAASQQSFWRTALPALCVLLTLGIGRRVSGRSGRPPGSRERWLLVPILAALALWAVRFPTPRYGMPFMWLLAGLTVAECYRTAAASSRTVRLVVVALLLGLASLPALGPPVYLATHGEASFGSLLRARFLARPWPGRLLPSRSVQLHELRTESGLRLFQPVTGRACWAAPLTCTPLPRASLRERVPGSLRHGFAAGEWIPGERR